MRTSKRKFTFLGAAREILEEMKQPMHFKKITELAIQKKYIESKGKTPEWTMGARLSVEVKEGGINSDFIRVGNGKYGLRRWKRGKINLGGTSIRKKREQTYWLVSVEPENYYSDLEAGTLDTVGVKHRMRRTLERLHPGDGVVIYLKRDATFNAILEISGKAFHETSNRWPVAADELSARIACNPVTVLEKNNSLDARPIYSGLEVFTQYPAKHRTLALRNGITELTQRDYETIKSAMITHLE